MPLSDVSFVGEDYHRHVLELTPPLPTQPSVSAMPSAPVTMASATATTTPTIPTKGGRVLLSRIRSVKKWDMRSRSGNLTTFEAIGMLIFNIPFKSFPNLSLPLAAESQSRDNPDRTPRPETSVLPFTHESSKSSLYPSLPNGTSSAADTQHTHTLVFFELLVALAALGLLLHAQD